MFDIADNEVSIGDKVKILKCDYSNFIGKIFTVASYQDCKNKIKVNISDQWQGYFYPHEIVKVEKHKKNKINLKDESTVFEILFNNKHPLRSEIINQIKNELITIENIFNYLNKIDSCGYFSHKQWFEFGVIFSKDANK
jgi:hypothetical protein